MKKGKTHAGVPSENLPDGHDFLPHYKAFTVLHKSLKTRTHWYWYSKGFKYIDYIITDPAKKANTVF